MKSWHKTSDVQKETDKRMESFNQTINALAEAAKQKKMDWEVLRLNADEILEMFRNVEKAEVHVSYYIYQMEGENFVVYLRFREEDIDKVREQVWKF
jgi:hypothetical protein